MTKKVSDVEIEAALRKNKGILGLAADDLGITRPALVERVDRNVGLQRVREDIDERILDSCEDVIFECAAKNDDNGLNARWLAERKGKHRGYGSQVQATLGEKELEAFVFAFGGDANKLRALRDTIGTEKPRKPK